MSRPAWLVRPGEATCPAEVSALVTEYRRIDLSCGRFARTAPRRCPTGCGICCAQTDPECLHAEAELIARFLLFHRPGVASDLAFGAPRPAGLPCPLYDPDSDAHCTVYAARPAICRLFGYSGAPDSRGRLSYRPCRHMVDAGAAAAQTRPAPDMVAAYRRVGAVSASGAELRLPLTVALPAALRRLLLRERLAGAAS